MNETNTGTPAAFFAGIVTERYFETWRFYTELLGFSTWEESDHHVLLAHPSGARLEIVQHETDERNPELVSGTDGRGFWFTLEVDELDSEYARLCASGIVAVHPPELSLHGRRAFTVRDPNGVLVCLCARQGVEAEVEWKSMVAER